MSLPALRLYHGRTNGGAVSECAAVAGATPPFGCLVGHGDGRDVHGHPNLAWGRSPVHQSLAGRLSVTGDGRGPKPKATAAAKAIGHGFAFGAVGGMFAPRVALPAIIMKPQDSATLRARSRG